MNRLLDRPIGEDLRAVRLHLGLTFDQVSRRSEGRFLGPALGSYERAQRNVSVVRCREILDWYGGWRLAVLNPGDCIFRAGAEGGDPSVQYVVLLDRPDGKCVDCSSREEAVDIAATIPGARVGYRLLGPVKFEAEATT